MEQRAARLTWSPSDKLTESAARSEHPLSLWNELGFRSSPYETNPIPPTEQGDQLLVGRNKELSRLVRYLTSSGLHSTIEGDNGVGKSSLVAVAGYRLKRDFENQLSAQAVIPMGDSFQLSAEDSANEFRARVMYAVARAFIDHRDLLKHGGLNVPEVKAVDSWLNKPVFSQNGGGATVAGFGAQSNRGSQPNTSQGFTDAGFVQTVTKWLRDCFPSRESGGFLCVIDNLELLETSRATRTLLESIRDDVLALPGLIWVLCGARGIVRTAASSPRLEGRLAEPMELLPVDDSDVIEAIRRRIDLFKVDASAVAPVGPAGFRHLYDVLNRNLRNALKYSEDFSFWIADNVDDGWNSEDADQLLQIWLSEKADDALRDTKITPRAWAVFDGIADSGGSVSPSNYEQFGFNSLQAMRPHVSSLEQANLAISAVDDTDKRRRTIMLSPRGWLVRYARSNYKTSGE